MEAGAQVLASYSIAKLIDNTNSEINWLEAASPGWGDANAYNLRGERSLDGFDVPQRLVIGSILDLPFGHGKKYANSVNGLTDKLIGGWGVNTIITFQSGYPIIVGGCPGALSNSGIPNTGCARPTRTAYSHLTGGSRAQKIAEVVRHFRIHCRRSHEFRLWDRFAYRAQHSFRRTKEL